jgi:MFS family permease
MIEKKSTVESRNVSGFGRSTVLFLTATVIDGIIISGWQLFFNFFILSRGFDRQFLGLVNAMPSLAALLFSIPLGMLSDRIGRKKSMLLGLAIAMVSYASLVMMSSASGLIILSFLVGVGNTLYTISQAPFLMGISTSENRALLFSLNFGLNTLAGAVGNLFAGQLPATFGRLLNVSADSTMAYEAVLLSCVVLGSFALVPIFFIHELPLSNPGRQVQKRTGFFSVFLKPMVWRLFLPNLLLGIGASILIPYMNIFFRERFSLPDGVLGLLFSLSALLTGLGTIVGPFLARGLQSKVKTIVLTQGVSLIFLLLTGFAPMAWLAATGFLLRTALMNMANPLFSAFAMEQITPDEQGTVNSILTMAWTIGWATCQYVSGVIQKYYGFTPLFIATSVLYCTSTVLVWIFFKRSERSAPVKV